MKLSEDLIKKLGKKFAQEGMKEMRYKGNDVAFKVDGDGNAVLVFVGKKNAEGTIMGERFVRTLIHDKEGKVIKDHWESKGKAS